MRVAFLVKDLQLSGGVNVVVEQARQLTLHHGMDVTLVRTEPSDAPDWRYRGLASVPVVDLEIAAAGTPFDVAAATWWETCLSLYEVPAARQASFVQLLEDSHYPARSPARLGFALTLALPVRYITEARWIAETLEALQPGCAPLLVPNGIAKDVFASPPAPAADEGGPLRIVVEGSLGLPRKGVPHALEAIRLMNEARHVTLVTSEAPSTSHPSVDEHLGALSHPELAALFARSHVLLKLSRAEGMYGPPLEAFHMGATCVTTPVTGHDMYVEHDCNALVVDWDDPAGTARALDLLARDRALLARLREDALATARTWPSWEESGARMAAALRTIAHEPPPDPAPAGRRLALDIATVLADVERREIDERAARQALVELRAQRAVRTAIKVRGRLTPVLTRARHARRRLRDR